MRKNRALLLLPALLVLLALTLSGCKDFSFYGVLGDRIDDTPLTISPATVTVPMSGALTFTATGGKPPYSFARVSGTGSIDAGTGLYTAPPTAGSETVRVTDSKGRRSDAAITVTTSGGMLAISPDAVSMGPGGSLSFIATGGTAPYTFSLTASGSGSPLINDGGIPGAYVAGASTGTDTIQVQDSALPTAATATATVNVTAAMVTVNYSLDEASFNFPANGTAGSAIPVGASFRIQNALLAGGTEPISWWVYLSDDGTLGSGDTLLDAGSRGLLAAGSWADVPFSGTWPLSSGLKYLFVMISAADDLDPGNNISSGSNAVTLAPPDINYVVTAVTPGADTTAGGDLDGTFDLANNGTSDGNQPVSWTVYISTNDTWEAVDPVVDAGVTPKLDAGFAQPGILFNGTWPDVPDPYYLIVKVSASDEPSPADTMGNTRATSLPVSVLAPIVDYAVSNVTYSGPISTPSGTAAAGSFQYSNSLGNGVQWVSWIVYASTDQLLSGDDLPVASGSARPLTLGESRIIPFNGVWPLTWGNYYLIAWVGSSEEKAATLGNNWASKANPAISVGIFDETLTDPPIVVVPPLGNGDYGLIAPCNLNVTFRPGLSVRINGSMDSSDVDDMFAFNTGTASTLTFHMTWSAPPNQDVRFFPMDGPNSFLSGVGVTGANHITWVWTPDAGSAPRWWDVENTSSKNIGPYLLIITAN